MPRLLNRPPKLCRHKASGKAVVSLGGRTVYLAAPLGSRACRDEYDRVVAEWLAGGRKLAPVGTDTLSVAELVEKFLTHADTYYRRPDGTPTSEASNLRSAVAPLVRLYGLTPAGDFSPLALRAVREEMIRARWCRTNINRAVSRLRLLFKWGAGHGFVPVTTWHGLQAVEALAAGRTGARESEPVRPVAGETVETTLPYMPSPVAAMVKLQMLTGMRTGEVITMTGEDIEAGEGVWTYTPKTHKTAYRGRQRRVLLGPRAQEVLKPFLKRDVSAPIFSPFDAVAEKRERLAEARTTPAGQGNGAGTHRVKRRKPRRTPSSQYSGVSYARAVARACDAAFMPPEFKPEPGKVYTQAERADLRRAREKWAKDNFAHRWHPYQLRHSAATTFRRIAGLEASRASLGHAKVSMTEHYAEMDIALAADLAKRIG